MPGIRSIVGEEKQVQSQAKALRIATFNNTLGVGATVHKAMVALIMLAGVYVRLASNYYQTAAEAVWSDIPVDPLTGPSPEPPSVSVPSLNGSLVLSNEPRTLSEIDEVVSDNGQIILQDQIRVGGFVAAAFENDAKGLAAVELAWTRLALHDFGAYVDAYLAQLMVDYTPTANKIGTTTTPKVPTSADAYDYVLELDAILDGTNTVERDRWVVVPPWFLQLLLSDTRFTGNRDRRPFAESQLTRGHAGWVGKLEVLGSARVPNASGTKYRILAGQSGPTGILGEPSGIVQTWVFDGFQKFVPPSIVGGTGVIGAMIGGAKVLNPDSFAELIVNKA